MERKDDRNEPAAPSSDPAGEGDAPAPSGHGAEPPAPSWESSDLPPPSGFPDDSPSALRQMTMSNRPPPADEASAPASEKHDSSAPPADKDGRKYQHRATVAAKAFRGLFWMVTTGVGSRIVSLISTLLLTRYILPEDYGDVQNTFIVCWMVDLITQLGLPQYIATRVDITPKQIHQATIYFHLVGTAALLLTWALAGVIGPRVGAPHMAAFMPGFFVAISLTRLATMPDRILVRQLRFRASSALRAGSEIAYALVSLGLAAASRRFDFTIAGHEIMFSGGFAIVWGNIARGLFRSAATIAVTRLRDWFAFVRLDRTTARELFSFGVPITIAGLGSIGARRWDNLVIANLYGSAASGIYNIAYNVADVPPSVVGESLGDVLAPTFANTAPADRSRELVRWVGVSALVCFPLGVGLSAVAPSLSWMFGERWYAAVPMIILLGSLSLTRPIIGTVFAYLQALGMGRTLMFLEWFKAIGIVVIMLGIGHAMRAFTSVDVNNHYGPNLMCAAVGLVMVGSTLSYQLVGARAGGIAPGKLIGPLFRPLLACVPMILAVLAVRYAFGRVDSKVLQILRLTCEVLAGGVAFVGGAFVIARHATRELIELLKSSLAKRRSGGSE